jgi:hypothetical protein
MSKPVPAFSATKTASMTKPGTSTTGAMGKTKQIESAAKGAVKYATGGHVKRPKMNSTM